MRGCAGSIGGIGPRPVRWEQKSEALLAALKKLQLVSDLHLAIADLSRRQLQHAMRFQANAGHSKWGHTMPKPENTQALAECNHINRKQHAERMNAGRGLDEEPASGIELSLAHQTNQAGERRVGYRYL